MRIERYTKGELWAVVFMASVATFFLTNLGLFIAQSMGVKL